jgi:O-antigen/teichoic acid export membrane protein
LFVAGSHERREAAWRAGAMALIERLRLLLVDDSDHSIARRMASTAFMIRVISAGIIYLSQILLARWMGGFEFGVYVYVWTWLVLVAGLAPLGIAYSTQRFIPEYTAAGDRERLRGFLTGSRLLSLGLGIGASAVGLVAVLLLGDLIDSHYRLPFLIALACVPAFTLSSAQDGVARSYNWIFVALVPGFVAQPILVLAIIVTEHFEGFDVNAAIAMAATAVAIWTTVIVQTLVLQRRLRGKVEAGPGRYEFGRWFKTALPIFLVDGFYFLLTYTDILVLKAFVDPDQIGIYYAATKTLVLISFIYYALSASFAHRFSEAHFAGRRDKLEAFIRDATRWTFWPSLAVALVLLALGKPILMLFGAEFTDGYPLLFVLVIGLLARASIGPGERLLIMVGEQRLCALIYAAAFLTNLALCVVMVPRFGLMGAAASTATALMVESALLFLMTKRRLGLHVFFWGRRAEA